MSNNFSFRQSRLLTKLALKLDLDTNRFYNLFESFDRLQLNIHETAHEHITALSRNIFQDENLLTTDDFKKSLIFIERILNHRLKHLKSFEMEIEKDQVSHSRDKLIIPTPYLISNLCQGQFEKVIVCDLLYLVSGMRGYCIVFDLTGEQLTCHNQELFECFNSFNHHFGRKFSRLLTLNKASEFLKTRKKTLFIRCLLSSIQDLLYEVDSISSFIFVSTSAQKLTIQGLFLLLEPYISVAEFLLKVLDDLRNENLGYECLNRVFESIIINNYGDRHVRIFVEKLLENFQTKYMELLLDWLNRGKIPLNQNHDFMITSKKLDPSQSLHSSRQEYFEVDKSCVPLQFENFSEDILLAGIYARTLISIVGLKNVPKMVFQRTSENFRLVLSNRLDLLNNMLLQLIWGNEGSLQNWIS